MPDEGSRLLRLDGVAVTAVHEVGDELELEVELVARAGLCPHCVRASLVIKERPVVSVRDLPLAGRPRCCAGASAAIGARSALARSPRPTPSFRPASA
jgi:hypothetical protein